MVILVGDKEFTEEYSDKLCKCTGKKIKNCIDRSNNVWNLKTSNVELFLLFKKVRENLDYLSNLLKKEIIMITL